MSDIAERFGIVEKGQRTLESFTVWMDRVGILLNTGALPCGADKLFNSFRIFLTCTNKTIKERFEHKECERAKRKVLCRRKRRYSRRTL